MLVRNEELVLKSDVFFYNWRDFLLKTNLFVGPSLNKIKRPNFIFLRYFRFKKSILNLYLIGFSIKRFFNFLKFFSYKYFKYQSFFFCTKDLRVINEFKKLFSSSFFYLVNLNRNPGTLNQFLNRLFIRPRFLFYFSDKHGMSFLKTIQKMGIPLYSFNTFSLTSSLFSYSLPLNYNYSFFYSFFFYFFFFFFKKDRFLYFYKIFLNK